MFIKEFRKINVSSVELAVESHNLEVMLNFRKMLIESPIRSEKEEMYLSLVHQIYSEKARYFNPPINKNQFKKIITYGGQNATNLLHSNRKADRLNKAYEMIDRAQKEVFTSPNNRNEKNLLQTADYKKLMEDLEPDPFERNKVDKWYIEVKKVR